MESIFHPFRVTHRRSPVEGRAERSGSRRVTQSAVDVGVVGLIVIMMMMMGPFIQRDPVLLALAFATQSRWSSR